MGVSFKISKVGRRFRPKPTLGSEAVADDSSEQLNLKESVLEPKIEAALENRGGDISGFSEPSASDVSAEHEVSFTLSLYPNGYSLGKPSENEAVQQAPFRDAPKIPHPYDRASENLFSAIEAGRLPGDILEDIPCKFVDGAVICEVRDYRKHTPEQVCPAINKVRLKMSLENVVKDIPLMSDTSWTYGDLMEIESRILKALQPELCLDPAPKLDRLCKDPVPVKLNLSLSSLRKKRLRQMPEVTVMSHNRIHGKKFCIDKMPESSEQGTISGHLIMQQGQNNLAAQNLDPNMLAGLRSQTLQDGSNPSLPLVSQQQRFLGTENLKNMQDQGSNSVSVSGASPGGQDMMISYASDNMNLGASLHGKRENQEGQMSPMSGFNKRARVLHMGPDGVPQQQLGQRMDGLHGTDISWKNSLLHQQVLMGRGVQYPNAGIQRFSPQQLEGVMNQEGGSMQFSAAQQGVMRYNAKEEPFDSAKIDGSIKNDMPMVGTDTSPLDPRVHSRLPHNTFMRSNFPQASWNNNIGQQIERDPRKEEQFNRRKSAQSPRLSSGAPPQSPHSSKSGEFSSGSMGTHFGAVAAAQKDKAAVTSIPAMGGAQSLASSANNDPMQQRQHQAQIVAKRRTNSLPKTQVMSGVGSPVSVNTMNVQVNAGSPSVGTQTLADQAMLDRFSKIERVAGRYQLNCQRHKVDEYSRRPRSYSQQDLMDCFSNLSNEDFQDDNKPLSKSIIAGSMNTRKIRILNFSKMDRVMQVPRIRTRLVMSEKSMDGTVAWYHGDIDDGDIFAAEDYLSTLPNTHMADLLAAEFCSLMMREGYDRKEHIQAKPNRVDTGPSSQQNSAGVFPRNNSAVEMQQCGEAVAGQVSGEAAKPGNAGNAPINSPQSILANTRMLPPANSQALQMSQGLLSGVSMPMRAQQLDPQQPSLPSSQAQQQNQQSLFPQQQHPQMQRPSMMHPTNPLSSINTMAQSSGMQPGGQMANKPSPLQLQMLQQQQQQQQQQPQQQAQMQRKMLMGLGSGVGMGMGNMGNSITGLGGMGNPMGMAGRGIGGTGIPSPMPSVSGIGNMGQNPMNLNPASNLNAISQQLRSGGLSPAHAAMMNKLRMGMVNRGGVFGSPQAGITGMPGGRQMHPSSAGLSMLGQNPLNRVNMSTIQRAAIGAMGPPKLMPGMNLYLNQQQLQQQQQHPQQQLQQHHPQQQLQQQHPQQQLHQQMSQPSQQLSQPQSQMSQPQQQQQLQQHQLPQPQQQMPQHQLAQQQQQQQQQLSQQQLSQPQQLQDTASPLQSVLSPAQVGSPSAGITQLSQTQQQQQQPQPQQASPQQMNQRTPMSPQISSGTMHPMSAGNLEACPASPQLSSQTLGSVGSITNSPRELQGAKNNSAGNP